jgi:drug/metabolite transporter (DMT)-like permease
MGERAKGVVAMLALAFVFGVMGVFARELEVGFSILQQVYLRIGLAFLFAALFFAPFVDWRGYLKVPMWEWGLLALRGVSMYVAASLWTFALLNASYSNVAFITAVPLLPLFGYYIFRDRLTPQIIVYIAAGVAGVLLIGVKDWADFSRTLVASGNQAPSTT